MIDVWLAVITELDRIPAIRVRAWIAAVVRNKVADQIRRRVRNPEIRLNDESEGASLLARESGPEELLESTWNQELATALVAELAKRVSDTCFEVFRLRTIEGNSVSEVAKSLGLSPKQVRDYHHRAKLRFRALVTIYTGNPLG